MLVLTRKIKEVIHIGDHVTVTVVRIGPNNVRLGIEAPQYMNIVRDEIINGRIVRRPVEQSDKPPTMIAEHEND
jgi:carbon storage regulator